MSHQNGRVASAERALPRHLHDDMVTGRIRQPGNHTGVVFHTNGSVSHLKTAKGLGLMTGWGYLSTAGHYGCGKVPQFAPKAGKDPAVVAELRAVWHAVGATLPEHHVTVATYSRHAASVLAAWRDGSTDMPAGYIGGSRKTSTLERLRRLVAAHPGHLTVQQLRGQNEDVLNEGADTLAQLGMRWGRDQLGRDDVAARAAGITAGFLADWRARQ